MLPEELVKQLAQEAGFDLCGIATRAEESPSAVLERVLNGQELYLLHPVSSLPGKLEGRRSRPPRPE